jgi:hypothetical protein
MNGGPDGYQGPPAFPDIKKRFSEETEDADEAQRGGISSTPDGGSLSGHSPGEITGQELEAAMTFLENSNTVSSRVVQVLRYLYYSQSKPNTIPRTDSSKDGLERRSSLSESEDPSLCRQNSSKRLRMTKQQALEIYHLRPNAGISDKLKRGSMSGCKALAVKYGVTAKTIRDIWRGRTWTEATMNEPESGGPHSRNRLRQDSGRRDDNPSMNRDMDSDGDMSSDDADQVHYDSPSPALSLTHSFPPPHSFSVPLRLYLARCFQRPLCNPGFLHNSAFSRFGAGGQMNPTPTAYLLLSMTLPRYLLVFWRLIRCDRRRT